MGLFDKNVQRKGKGLFSTEGDPYSLDKVNRQIDNANQRIEDAGYSKQNADSRNGFEKFTNLPQGQNWFFDTLELLGRGGNAIKNVIDYGIQKRDDTGTAIYKGLSGQEKVSGADITGKLGVENKAAKFVTGLALDIGTDPLTYVPGGVLLKGAKGAGKLTAAPIKAGYNVLEEASPALRTLRETRIEPALASGKDALGYMFNSKYKRDETLGGGKSTALDDLAQQTDNSRAYMQEENLLNLGNAAKAAGGIEKGVDAGRIVEAPLKQFEDIQAYEMPGVIPPTTDKTQFFAKATENRATVQNLGKEVRQTRKEYDQAISQTAKDLDQLDRTIRRQFDSAEKQKLRTLQKSNSGQPTQSTLRKGFAPTSPAVNLLMQKGDEVKSQLDSMRQEIGSVKVRKKQYTPEQMQELAGSRAIKQLSPSPVFNLMLQRRDELKGQLDNLRSTSKEVNVDKIAQIRNLVDETERLKEATKNPITIQQEIPRPVRELSDDPKIQQAATSLIESNESIRKFASDNGIEIKDMQGYMTHVWSQEERNARKIKQPKKIDQGSFGTGNPNKSILKNRELMGSVEDVNEKVGRKFFEPNAFFASAIGQKRLIDYVHAVNFRRQVLSNPDFAVKYVKGGDIPRNAEVIDTNNYKFLKETGDELDGIVPAEQIGGQYVVTKAAKQLLDRYQRLNTDEGTKAFLKAYDGLQSFWKRAALFSLGYHVRNQAGAMFNNYVGGMSTVDLVKYTKDGFQEVAQSIGGKESKMFNEYRQQGLSSSALSKVEFAKYGEEPESAIEKTVKNLSKDTKGQATQRLNPLNAFQTSQEVGNFFDQANRFAIYKWARESKKMSPEEAAAKVRETQFDYSQTTPFESNVAARVLPFYRWMKNNIPFQIRQFVNDPRKYEYINKLRMNAQDATGINEDNIPDYMKENFSIPLSGSDGKGKMLGLNLPLGDLTKLSRPGKTVVDSISPLLKTPTELALNYNTFRGKPIQKFEGQSKKYEIFGKEFGIPIKTAYGLEQTTGQIGRGLSGFLQKPESVDQDTLNRLPTLGVSSIFKEFDVKKYEYYEKLNELKQLQDLMLFIEQQTGEKPRTLSEIK